MTREGMIVEIPVVPPRAQDVYTPYAPPYREYGELRRNTDYAIRQNDAYARGRDPNADPYQRMPTESVNSREAAQKPPNDGMRHRNAGKARPVKDKNFTKFLEEPLPMRPVKLILSIVLVAISVFSAYNAFKAGALDIIRTEGATGQSIAGFILAAVWLIAAVIGFTVKYKKGATLAAGVLLLFTTGIAYTTQENIKYGMYYAVFSFLASIIFLISGAGGVSMDGLE